jgi:hypothetical protein
MTCRRGYRRAMGKIGYADRRMRLDCRVAMNEHAQRQLLFPLLSVSRATGKLRWWLIFSGEALVA